MEMKCSTRSLFITAVFVILQVSKSYDECTVGCHMCILGICNQCKYGYHGINCEHTCATHCRSGVCEDNRCISGCHIGYYGDECQFKCSSCYSGCDQYFGECIVPKDDREDDDYEYTSTQSHSKLKALLKVIGAVVAILVTVFIIAVCCRRQSSSSTNNDNDDDEDDDMRCENSSLNRNRANRRGINSMHQHAARNHRQEDVARPHRINMGVEPGTPMFNPLTLEEPITPPPAHPSAPLPAPPPAPPPTPPQPVFQTAPRPGAEPPPSYKSLFPDRET